MEDPTEPGVVANWATNIPDALTFHPEATPWAIRVYLALKSFHKGSFPSIGWLAERLGCSQDTIRTAMRCLERIGYLVVEARYREDGGRSSNLYRVRDTPSRRTEGVPGVEPRGSLAENRGQEHLQEEHLQEDVKPLARSRRSRKPDPDDPIPTAARRIVDAVIAQRKAEGKPKPMVGFVQVNDVRSLLRNGHSEADVLWAALNAATIRAGAMEIALSNRSRSAPTDPTKAAMDDGSFGLPENLRPAPGKSRILTPDEVRAFAIGSSDGKP